MQEGWYMVIINGKDWSSPSESTARQLAKNAGNQGKTVELRKLNAPGKGSKLLASWKDGRKTK